jgi:hypothetical protein
MHRRSLPIGASALVASLAAPPARAQALEAWLAPRARLWERWVAHDAAATARLDHRAWTGFLQRYRQVGTDRIARINYAAVTPADRAVLEAWLSGLAGTSVAQLNRAEQFAYWVNLYNGLTVRTVLGGYPVRSIRDLNFSGGVLLRGPWDAHLVTIAGEAVTLNDIEHRILRPIWRDPRVHYVLNCASLGCPDMPAEALDRSTLEPVLDAAAASFIAHERGVAVRPEGLRLSSIYNWFSEDFATDGGVVPHLLRHATPAKATAIRAMPAIRGFGYDWALNDVRGL